MANLFIDSTFPIGSIGPYTAGTAPAVTVLNDGTAVVAFTQTLIFADGASDDVDGAIFLRRFAEDGTPIGTVIQANVTEPGIQGQPDIVALPDGGFAVGWITYAPLGQGHNDTDAILRIFNADGSPRTGELVASVDEPVDDVDDDNVTLSLAVHDNGNILVSFSDGGPVRGVYAQTFSSTGEKIGSEVAVYSGLTTLKNTAALNSGDVVFGSSGAIWLTGPTGEGAPSIVSGATGPVMIDFGRSDARAVEVAALANGGFVAAYDEIPVGPDTFYIHVFDAQANQIAEISFPSPGTQQAPILYDYDLVPLADGSFLFVYPGEDGDGRGIYARHFSQEGVQLDGEARINSVLDGEQHSQSLVQLGSGEVFGAFLDYSYADDPARLLQGTVISLIEGYPVLGDRFDGIPGEFLYYFAESGDDFVFAGGFQAEYFPEQSSQVYRLYQATLGREPDRQGQLDWTDLLQEGAISPQETVGGFVRSPEFQSVYGELDDNAFVTLLYQNVLGREPDAVGLEGWLGLIDDGMSREDVVLGFSDSAEFITATQAQTALFARNANPGNWVDEVFRLYAATLDRLPDVAGLTGWTQILAEGRDFLDVIEGFTLSTEFQQVYGALDDAAFVDLLYTNVLGRSGEAEGLAGWIALLDDGMSRAEVVRGFSESPEFINASAAPLEAWARSVGENTIESGAGDDFLAGGALSDRFVYNVSDQGADVISDLDPWDTIFFNGFGYADAAAVRAQITDTADGAVFSDRGVEITFEGITLAQLSDAMLEV